MSTRRHVHLTPHCFILTVKIAHVNWNWPFSGGGGGSVKCCCVGLVREFQASSNGLLVTLKVIYNRNYLLSFYLPFCFLISVVVSHDLLYLFYLMISYHPVSLFHFSLFFSCFVLVVVIVDAYHVVLAV